MTAPGELYVEHESEVAGLRCAPVTCRYMPLHAVTCRHMPLHASGAVGGRGVHPLHAVTCRYMPLHAVACQ